MIPQVYYPITPIIMVMIVEKIVFPIEKDQHLKIQLI